MMKGLWGKIFLNIAFVALVLGPPLAMKTWLVTRTAKSETAILHEGIAKTRMLRLQLLMALDLIVRAEKKIFLDTGSYSRALDQLPNVWSGIAQYYTVDITLASPQQLLIMASAVRGGYGPTGVESKSSTVDSGSILGDQISIDGNFNVSANFLIPYPPRSYLLELAKVNIVDLQKRSSSPEMASDVIDLVPKKEGVFSGYFRYERRRNSKGQVSVVAVGTRRPVERELVDLSGAAPVQGNEEGVAEWARVDPLADQQIPSLYHWFYQNSARAGSVIEPRAILQKVHLAQRFCVEHTGHYAASLEELVPYWPELKILENGETGLLLQNFRLDPSFGFSVDLVQTGQSREVLRPDPVQEVDPSGRRLSAAGEGVSLLPLRRWSLNGLGQVVESTELDVALRQFEQARKRLGPGSAPTTGEVRLMIDEIPADTVIENTEE